MLVVIQFIVLCGAQCRHYLPTAAGYGSRPRGIRPMNRRSQTPRGERQFGWSDFVRRACKSGFCGGDHAEFSSKMDDKKRQQQLRQWKPTLQHGARINPLSRAKGSRHRFANRLASTAAVRSRQLGHEGRCRWNDFIGIASMRRTPELTDRRRNRALAADPVSYVPSRSNPRRRAAVRVD